MQAFDQSITSIISVNNREYFVQPHYLVFSVKHNIQILAYKYFKGLILTIISC